MIIFSVEAVTIHNEMESSVLKIETLKIGYFFTGSNSPTQDFFPSNFSEVGGTSSKTNIAERPKV